MELRDHPLLSFGGHHSWPPAWTWIGGKSDRYLTGEIGVLKELRMPESPAKKFYMIIEYEESLYMGCLLTREPAFCGQKAGSRVRRHPIYKDSSYSMIM